MVLRDAIQGGVQEAAGQPVGHRQVHIQVVAAVLGTGSGNIALEVTDEFKHLRQQGNHIP